MKPRLRPSTLAAVLAATATILVPSSAGAATPTITEFTTGISAGSNLTGITTGSDGNLWFTGGGIFSGGRIWKITPAGAVTEMPLTPAAARAPSNIAGGHDGNLWFAQHQNNSIGRMTPAGAFTEFTVPTAASRPQGITAGQDGNIWFTEAVGNKIGKITPAGDITEYPIPTPNSGPTDIVAGSAANLWFTMGDRDKIGRINFAGDITEFGSAEGILPGPINGITAGPDGALWFTQGGSPGSDRIGRITPAGAVQNFNAGIPNGSVPTDITAAQDGNLWFTMFSGAEIGRITPSGTVDTFGFAEGMSAGAQPLGITAGPDGNLWFTEFNTDKIGRINTALDAPTFTNSTSISILTVGAASPYPSLVNVTGLQNRRITDVSVRLTGISHTNPTDIDLLLVAPGGESVLLSTDAGGNTARNGVTLNLSDSNPYPLDSGALRSGLFRPASIGLANFPAPAPTGPYGSTFATLDGKNPNGQWQLYAADDAAGGTGAIHGGWGLDIQSEIVPIPTVAAVAPVSPANDNAPEVTGSAEAGSTVSLYSNATCSSALLASGPAETFNSTGITAPVPDDTATTIYAAIADSNGNVSACSATSVTYVENSTAPAITPDTTITRKPKAKLKASKKVNVAFEFSSSIAGSTFECALDKAAPTQCSSPRTYKVGKGKHTFSVTASAAGQKDATPATFAFEVKKKKKKRKK